MRTARGGRIDALERVFRDERGRVARDPDPRPRRLRSRRGRGAGRVRDGARALAARRRPARTRAPGSSTDRAQRGDRPDAARAGRSSARPSCSARARAAGRGGGRGRPDPRRAARADLHLLPPGARREAQVALTLRLLCGLTTRGDRARLPRPGGDDGAAARAREAEDPRRRHPVPRAARPPAAGAARGRAGASSTSSSTRATAPPVRAELCDEAIRLGELLAELMPDEPEVLGLLALMLLHDARRDARDAATASWCCSRSRTARAGTAAEIDGGPPPGRPRAAPAAGPARTSCRRRSRRCHLERRDRLAADRRALRRARSRVSAVAGRRAQPRGRGRDGRRARRRARADRRGSTGSTATTCCTPRAPICCAGSAATTRRPPRTSARSRWRRTSRSAPSSRSAYDRSHARTAGARRHPDRRRRLRRSLARTAHRRRRARRSSAPRTSCSTRRCSPRLRRG